MSGESAYIQALFSLGAANELPNPWHQHVHGRHRLLVIIQPHVEGLHHHTTATQLFTTCYQSAVPRHKTKPLKPCCTSYHCPLGQPNVFQSPQPSARAPRIASVRSSFSVCVTSTLVSETLLRSCTAVKTQVLDTCTHSMQCCLLLI